MKGNGNEEWEYLIFPPYLGGWLNQPGRLYPPGNQKGHTSHDRARHPS